MVQNTARQPEALANAFGGGRRSIERNAATSPQSDVIECGGISDGAFYVAEELDEHPSDYWGSGFKVQCLSKKGNLREIREIRRTSEKDPRRQWALVGLVMGTFHARTFLESARSACCRLLE
jgi:hypothetical protein